VKILFSSYAFSPSVGGIETVSAILAEGFVAAGHEVVLATETPGESTEGSSYPVVRQPSIRRLLDWLNWCDVFLQNNISLRTLIPALLLRRRAAVVHQTWIRGVSGRIGWNDRIKHLLLPRVRNVAISAAIADELKVGSEVIPNPYRDDVFRLIPGIERNKALVFLGRLVSDKGVDLLLEALVLLRKEGLTPDLTIIGTGSEEANLRTQSHVSGLDGQVTFLGGRSGSALAEVLNEHRILVVPSRWAEPFGVVALEGMACGCVVVGSESGGLQEAIGTGGVTFPNGDAAALADALRKLLRDPAAETALRLNAQTHLPRFSAATVTQQYLSLLESLAR
jgi:glycosyltransferase involved in cell wall biosynthesis